MLTQLYELSVDKIRTKIPFPVKRYIKFKLAKNRVFGLFYKQFLIKVIGLKENPKKFPKMIAIELTNKCNSDCIMCPRDKLTRKLGFMDLELYKKIINQCVDNRAREVRLTNFGEPLLHPKIAEFVKIASQKNLRVSFISNGSLLKKEFAEKLIDAGTDEIWVSIDSCERETYNKIRRNLDYDILRKNVIDLMNLKKKYGKPKIFISSVLINTKERKKFIKTWGPYSDDILFVLYNDWCGQNRLKKEQEIKKTWPCPLLWKRMSVLWNGDVAFCCRDINGDFIMGNVNESSLREIYLGKKYNLLRRLHLKGNADQIEICKNCKSAVFY